MKQDFMNEKVKPCCKCKQFTKVSGHGYCKKEKQWKARKRTCETWIAK